MGSVTIPVSYYLLDQLSDFFERIALTLVFFDDGVIRHMQIISYDRGHAYLRNVYKVIYICRNSYRKLFSLVTVSIYHSIIYIWEIVCQTERTFISKGLTFAVD